MSVRGTPAILVLSFRVAVVMVVFSVFLPQSRLAFVATLRPSTKQKALSDLFIYSHPASCVKKRLPPQENMPNPLLFHKSRRETLKLAKTEMP
jgi:hypothetical protein